MIRRRGNDDGGSGALVAVGVIAALMAFVLALAPVLGFLVARQRAANAADAAALSGADVASGAAAGIVCEEAERAAAANEATLASCEVRGETVSVVASVAWLGVVLRARSRAGPAP